ncbi:hypothetical protein BKA62DRAFT_286486 [Auriculariales sp. MPI-PUGE-AT-0066]|nr:hypothetical protein BKA62DRAFT_286486 [Auriculariales sp. MPI-PUGE-AT-0066]
MPPSPPPTSRLRALYKPATDAFVARDFVSTQAAIDDALAILAAHPPSHNPDLDDPAITTHRRKWDMLHVTLDVNVYLAPRAPNLAAHPLFAELRGLIPRALVAHMHARSVRLFTPPDSPPDSAFLPVQLVTNLITASARLNCPLDARAIAENWMRAHDFDNDPAAVTLFSGEEFDRLAQNYVAYVLVTLHDWDAVDTFLRTNPVLSNVMRKHLIKSLKSARRQAQTTSRPPSIPPTPTADLTPTQTPTRGLSPSLSSSSVSTSSTKTARPLNANALGLSSAGPSRTHAILSPSPRPSTPSGESQATATPRPRQHVHSQHQLQFPPDPNSLQSTQSRARSLASSSTPSSHTPLPGTATAIYASLRSALQQYLSRLGLSLRQSNVVLFLLFFAFPFFAAGWRMVHARRRGGLAVLPPGSHMGMLDVFPALDPAEAARARLMATGPAWWSAALSSVMDVVKMASGGLA